MGPPEGTSSGQASTGTAAHGRVRSVDAFRAFAILTVVLGHWLAFALTVRDRELGGENLLYLWPPAPWLTWFFQVMPIFFLVGGYAAQASWVRHPDDVTTLTWIGARLWRLMVPTAVLLTAVVLASVVARAAGADETLVREALATAGLPLWFLAVYVAAVPMTPLLSAGVRRWGLGWPASLLGAALAADAMFVHLDVPLVGWGNYGFFWLGMFSLGIAWRAGSLPPYGPLPVVLLLGGASGLVLLVTLGPYPVNMLAAPGEPVQNNGPPSAALLALGVAQTGVVLLLADHVERWCRSTWLWRGVVAVNRVAMSIYLWHMVAGLIAAVIFWQTGLAALAEAPSGEWFAWRPVWYAVCSLVLVALVRVVRWAERPLPVWSGGVASAPGPVIGTLVGLLTACGGMIHLAVVGLDAGSVSMPMGVLAFLAGSALLLVSTGTSGALRRPDATLTG